jgi:hypothetical protein
LARAPATAFYFEPISERLVLVVEGSPFPSDDHWAWLGDPIDVTPEQARLTVAVRWPGIDPEQLTIEFDTNFEGAIAEAERQRLEREAGLVRVPLEHDLDINQLLEQAQALRLAVERMSAAESAPNSHPQGALESALRRELEDRAMALAQSESQGRPMVVQEWMPAPAPDVKRRPPQRVPTSQRALPGVKPASAPSEAAAAPVPTAAEKPAVKTRPNLKRDK